VLATLTDEPVSPNLAIRQPVSRFRFEQTIAPLWMAGTIAGLALFAAGLVQLKRMARRSERLTSGRWVDAAADVSRTYGLRRPVALLQSVHPSLLVTWGVRHPKVLLPVGAQAWTDERVRVVLAHELAHVRRRDWMVHAGAQLGRAAFWFNPLMWMACRRLSDESEQACDDEVLRLGIQGSVYATHLVELARAFKSYRRSGIVPAPAPAIVKSSSLERRVRAMLQFGLNRNRLSLTASAATLAALIAITVPLAGFGAAQSGPATFGGTLVDAMGRLLPDVPVAFINSTTGADMETRTDQSGRFKFDNLPAGTYELTASLPGFGGKYLVALAAGQNLQREVPLQIGVIEESISIVRSVAPRPSKPSVARPEYQPESDPCRQSPVGGCIVPPIKLRDVRPVYPADADDVGRTIRLQGVIGTDGIVKGLTGVDVAPADEAFARAAIAAVEQWQFAPTRLDGVTVETHMHVTVKFSPQ
jgi:beta-lactamase regulating signal transducer with metallopeptidase domain